MQRITTKEKSAQISGRSTKMDAALRRNADFASKPCVLQHFGSPPFNSITSKYCKGYKFHKKEDFKMLKNRGVVPGPVTLFVSLVKLLFYHNLLFIQLYLTCLRFSFFFSGCNRKPRKARVSVPERHSNT